MIRFTFTAVLLSVASAISLDQESEEASVVNIVHVAGDNYIIQNGEVAFEGPFEWVVHDDERLDWFNAQARCEEEGGNLASIHSEEEHLEIRALIGNKRYWLGGREYSKGWWGWNDGTPTDYGRWAAGQPNHRWADQNNCLAFWDNQTTNWHDHACDYTGV